MAQSKADSEKASENESEIKDDLDTTTKVAADLSGKRIRAIPGLGGTTVNLSDRDFAANGISHPAVSFRLRVNQFTLQVGTEISEEAANFLVEKYPASYQFVN